MQPHPRLSVNNIKKLIAYVKKNTRLQQSINLYTFAIFLYINQICKVSLRSSVASVSGEWPGSPSKGSSFLPRSATKIFKNTSEQYQLQFITDYLLEILDILSDPQPTESPTSPVGCDDKSLPSSALDALSLIFEGSIDRLSTIQPIRDILLDPLCISHVGYDKSKKTFSMRCLYSWIRANLCQCPFSVESCLLNGTRIQWGMVENKVEGSTNLSSKSYRRPRIVTNMQQLPPSTGFRGNKIVVAEALHKQFIARASRFLKYSTFRLHRANSSFIYLLVPLRCVALDRCRNSTIVLGPIESTLTITDCEDCVIIAPARRVVVWASRRLTLHLLCATRPLLLQTATASSMPTATNVDVHSCPPSPLIGMSRRRNPLSNENIVFAPFHTTYPELKHHLDKAALDCNVNYWDKPVLFGSDFWHSGNSQRHSNGVWSLLSPDNFFPFNIPLAPLVPVEEAVTQNGDFGSNVLAGGNRTMYSKQYACDVCRGTIVSSDRDSDSGSKKDGRDLDGSERPEGEVELEDLDSLAKWTLLLVPLPQAYAEAILERRSAYANWQKTILDADLSADESLFLSECIEAQFKSWLVETGAIKELKILDAVTSVDKKLLKQQQDARTFRERVDSTLALALFYFDQSNFTASISSYKNLLTLYKTHGSIDKIQLALTYRAISECYIELGDFNEAIKYSSQYLKISKEVNNKLEQQRAYVTIGRCFQCRADSVSNGEIAKKSLLAAQQAILISLKITDQLTDLSSAQIGEMQAEISIQRVRDLISALVSLWPLISQSRLRPLDLLSHEETSKLSSALSLCSQTLKLFSAQQCTSKETKAVRRNLEELLAQLYIATGSYRTAAKVYRQLSRADPDSGLGYKELCGKCLRLEKIMSGFQNFDWESVDGMLQIAKLYEKIGDILSTMDLHSPAFRFYQQMLLYSEVAFSKRKSVAVDNDSIGELEMLVKQVDSGLVSSAEACAGFGAYALCAHFYRREILFNLSVSKDSLSSLSQVDLAQSWLSVAKALIRAPKNIPPGFAPPTCDTLEGSYSPEDALKCALSLAKSQKCPEILRTVLEELVEYHRSCGKETKAKEYASELEALSSDQDESPKSGSTGPARSCNKDSDVEIDLDTQKGAIGEAIDVLSSDSEVEQCINISDAATDLVESPGKRRNKALCLKTNLKGESPLHVAAINGNLEHAVKLVEVLGHPINVRDGAGWLPIHEAAFHDHADIATYLLDKGASFEDTGCPVDHSTPLFEAIHGNALKTAIIFVNRGANLWHVNAEGETLSDLLNSWEPKKNVPGGIVPQKALFHQLMNAVREKLGDSYDDWCSYRPPKPKIRTPTPSVTIINDEWENEGDDGSTAKERLARSRRRLRSFSEDEEEDGKENARKWNSSKPSRRDRRFDSPPPTPSPPKPRKKALVTHAKQDSSAINDYRRAMKTIRGSGALYSSHPSTSKRLSIPADMDDDWLEDDVGLGARRRQKKRARSDLPPSSHNLSSSPKPKHLGHDSNSANASFHLSECVEFDPSEAFCSTQVEAQMFPRPTHIPESSPSSAISSSQQCQPSGVSQPVETPGSSVAGVWCTIKVTFSDISLLLPVDSQSRSVKWLADEAYRRHQLLLEREASVPSNLQVRIRTSDGALLLPTDLLCAVLPRVTGTPELMAEIVQRPKLPPPPQKCSQVPLTSNEQRWDPSAIEGNLNHLSSHLRQLIISALESGFLNLSFRALEVKGCASALTDYLKVRSVGQPLTKLNLDGNLLSLTERSSAESSALLSVFPKIMTPDLKNLSLASNFLTLDDVLALLASGKNGHLTHLCLNHNPLFSQSRNALGSPSTWLAKVETSGFDFESPLSGTPLPKLSRLLTICPHLVNLQLVNCGITPTVWEVSTMSRGGNTDHSFLYHSPESALSIPAFAQLTELDLSLNPLSSKLICTDSDFLLDLLTPPSSRGTRPDFSSLHTLRLRRSLEDERAETAIVGSWILRESSPVEFEAKPSGDAFIGCLARFLDSGKFSIQTLDVSDCNLTEACLTNFQRLLAAPSTTLTTLYCDCNSQLKMPEVWAKVISTSAQATSALTVLRIDAPLVETESDLDIVAEAISRKMSLHTCSTPLQELTVTTADCSTWPGDPPLPVGKRVALSSSLMTSALEKTTSVAPLSVRLLNRIASCFVQCFGKLSNVCRLENERSHLEKQLKEIEGQTSLAEKELKSVEKEHSEMRMEGVKLQEKKQLLLSKLQIVKAKNDRLHQMFAQNQDSERELEERLTNCKTQMNSERSRLNGEYLKLQNPIFTELSIRETKDFDLPEM
ncbi:hypothetical protein Aperf_G00000100172 [Anoplocephala perfoliata]